MQAIACRSIEGLLARLFDTTGHLPNVEPSCEYLGEVNAHTGFIVKDTRKFRSKSIIFLNRSKNSLRWSGPVEMRSGFRR